MKQILMNTRLLNDIKKLSSEDQTSCLEGFHSTLNQFHPKMICFSRLGTYSRWGEEIVLLDVRGGCRLPTLENFYKSNLF